MTDDSVYRLVKAGFIKSKYKPLYAGLDASARARLAKSFPGKEVEEHADVDIIEIAKDQMISTEYPASKRKWRLIFESTRNIDPGLRKRYGILRVYQDNRQLHSK